MKFLTRSMALELGHNFPSSSHSAVLQKLRPASNINDKIDSILFFIYNYTYFLKSIWFVFLNYRFLARHKMHQLYVFSVGKILLLKFNIKAWVSLIRNAFICRYVIER